jgi:hypothetical protein
MNFIIIYQVATPISDLFKESKIHYESLNSHKAALLFINEIIEPNPDYTLLKLIHGAVIET